MKINSKALLGALLVGGAVSAAHADVLLDTFAGNAPGYDPGGAGWLIAASQSIDRPFSVVGSFNLTSIDVAISLATLVNTTFDVQLRSDSGGNPGAVLESFAVTVTPTGGTNTLYTISSVTNPLMTSGNYHLTMATTDPLGAGGWGWSNDGHTAPQMFSTDGGVTWTGFTNSDIATRITGASTVPEPASLAVLGLGAVALIRRRRTSK